MARSLRRRYPVRTVCVLLDVARSSVLYEGRPKRDLEAVRRMILTNRATFPTCGFKLMYQLLRRERVDCTRSEVRTVYKELGIMGKRPAARAHTTDSRHEHPRYPNLFWKLSAERPNQVWVADTLEMRVGGKRAFLALVEDVYTRRVMGFAISHTNDALLTLEALQRALRLGKPEIHHSDQGRTYASNLYTKRLAGIALSMAAVGRAWENGYAERLNRTFREEEIARSEYESLSRAHASIAAYAKLYNESRIHMSLGFRTPKEVYLAFGRDQEQGR
jgi:transposase InsO family protein